jgi:predicted nucleic acid-binding Zn ribbon protein
MYCSTCGTAITPGLSFCNRCGARLEEPPQQIRTAQVTAFLTAITLIAICGLGIMLGGSLVLRSEVGMPVGFVGVFMLFTFLITGVTEVMLIKNLSRLTGSSETKRHFTYVQPPAMSHQPPLELHPPTAQSFGEPIGSVTDNTTRTLEYARREH